MRRGVILALLVFSLALPVRALEVLEQERQILGIDTLQEGLPEAAQEALTSSSPDVYQDFGTAIFDLLRWAGGLSVSALREAVQTAAMLLTAVMLCQIVQQSHTVDRLHLYALTGAMALTLIFSTGMKTMSGLATQTLEQMQTYAKLLLPVMCGAAVASGAVTSASALYMGSSLFFSLLTTAAQSLLLPLVYAYLGLAALECGLQEGRLGALRQLLGWCVTVLLKGVMYVFTAYLSLTGLLAGSSDEAAINAAKSTLSAAIPVVGGIVSDASEAVVQSAKLLRASAGTFGLLAILAIILVPFFKLTICYLVMKLTTAIVALLGAKQHAALLGAQTTAMGYLLGVVGCVGIMLLFSVCCFLKVASG